jgi:tryptophan synthase alpha chain
MQSRIAKRFADLRAAGELGIVAYITAGDPTLNVTRDYVLALADAGADVIELGVPFSDPLADGPTIQRASERALKSGTTLAGVIALVRQIRQSSEVPLVLFSYFNPILQMGLEKFAAAAAEAGADGVLVTDLTPEESAEYREIMQAHHLNTIFLAAPTSTDERLVKIAACSSGFLYLISRTGVTGAKDALPDDLPALLRRARSFTQLPIAVGFGISLPGHVSVLGGLADAAVVGSALVSEIEKAASPEAAAAALRARLRALKEAASRGLSRREVAPGIWPTGGAASMKSTRNLSSCSTSVRSARWKSAASSRNRISRSTNPTAKAKCCKTPKAKTKARSPTPRFAAYLNASLTRRVPPSAWPCTAIHLQKRIPNDAAQAIFVLSLPNHRN